jgi:hypothetical protein
VPRQQRSDETSRPWQVRLDTPTGTVDYQLPIAIDETYNSTQVSTFLSPPGVEGPDAAQIHRRSNRVLGLPIGDDNYRFPKFQIDEARRMIRPVVAFPYLEERERKDDMNCGCVVAVMSTTGP